MKKGIMVVQGFKNEKNYLAGFARESIYADDVVANLFHKFVFEYTWDIATTAMIEEALIDQEYDLVVLTPDSKHYHGDISEWVSEDTELLHLEDTSYEEMTAKRTRAVFFS